MFFPFSKQSTVKTQKSSFSNNNHSTHNDFQISLLSFHPIMKIGSSNRNNTSIAKGPSSDFEAEEKPSETEMTPQEISFPKNGRYKTLILCTLSCFLGGTLTFCIINFMKKRKKI